jgi:photosystem II stability/assembly factor-like uncharacterized protein
MIQKLILLSLMLCWAGHGLHAQWTVKHLDENAYTLQSAIKFLDDSTGLYMGSNSIILKSEDAGETWNAIDLDLNIHFTDFQFVDDSVIYAVGTDHTISKLMRSVDRGDTWHPVADFRGALDFVILWFFDNNTGLVAVVDGIHRTVDSGATWDTVWTFDYSQEITKLAFTSEQVGYAIGWGFVNTHLSSGSEEPVWEYESFLLKTSDAGLTWELVQTFSEKVLTTFHFTNPDTGYIGTRYGWILKTTDGGKTWNETRVSQRSEVNSFHFISDDTGFATGFPNTIPPGRSFFVAKTNDGGESWFSYDTTGIPLNSIYFLNDSIGFVSGLYGLIMKTEGRIDQLPDDYPWHLAGVTNIIEINPELKNCCMVRLYPNPVKDVLHVDIDPSLLPTTEIIIYNVQGIALKHKHLNGYNHTISLGGLSKGFYFVSIKNGSYRQQHKIIVTR